MVSVVSFAIMNIVAKYLTSFNVYQIVFLRSIGTLVFTIPFLLKHKISVLGNNKKLLLTRAVLGVLSLTLFFQSLYYLKVGLAVSLRYVSPIFALLFASMILKERIRTPQVFFIVLSFIGVLIIKNFGGEVNSLGLLYVLLSAFFLGLIFVVIRKIGPTEHPMVIINYFMVATFIFGGFMSIFHWRNPNLLEWILFLSIGILGFLGQFFMTKAFQHSETNLIAPLKYMEVVFSILFGFLFFGDSYTHLTLLGVGLILTGLIVNVYLKNRIKKAP